MKVLLLEDVKGIGHRLDVKEVSDGYARNFLIPRKLARMATEKALAYKEEAESINKAGVDKSQADISRLANETLVFDVATGDKGEVFDPVSKDKIKKSLEQKGYGDFEIVLEQSLKKLGDQLVDIKFPRGLKGAIRVTLQQKQP